MIGKLFLIILLTIQNSQQLNILLHTPLIAQTHLSFFKTAVDILTANGHQVDVVYAYLNDAVDLSKAKLNTNRNYTYAFPTKNYWMRNTPHLQNPFVKPSRSFVDLKYFDQIAAEMCAVAIGDDDLLRFIDAKEYDLAITSDYDPCGAILFRAARINSVVSLVPTPLFQQQLISAGVPTPTSVYATTLCAEHDGSFIDKTFFLLKSAYYQYIWLPYIYAKYDKMAKSRFGADFPSAEQLERNIDLVFVNSHEIIEEQRPMSSKIKYIGGMGMRGRNGGAELTGKLASIVDEARKGVVLFSFGTQVRTRTIPVEIRANFIKAFEHFPDYAFVWKYDRNCSEDLKMFENSSNVHLFDWLPQTQLLYNPTVKLFITHMGLNSFLEATHSGTPVLSIPLFIDQQHNAQNARSLGIGTILNRDELSVENIVRAINEMLTNRKYSTNAQRIAKIIKEKPMKGEEVFIKWIEFAGKNPNLHKILNLKGAEMGPFTYYSGDVIFGMLFAIVCSIVLIGIMVVISFKMSKNVKNVKQKQL